MVIGWCVPARLVGAIALCAALSGAVSAAELDAARQQLADACRRDVAARYDISNFALAVVAVSPRGGEWYVSIDLGPRQDPERHRVACAYLAPDRLSGLSYSLPEPPRRPGAAVAPNTAATTPREAPPAATLDDVQRRLADACRHDALARYVTTPFSMRVTEVTIRSDAGRVGLALGPPDDPGRHSLHCFFNAAPGSRLNAVGYTGPEPPRLPLVPVRPGLDALDAEQRTWVEACYLGIRGRYEVDDLAVQVVKPPSDLDRPMVALDLEPPGTPYRYRFVCGFAADQDWAPMIGHSGREPPRRAP